MCPFIETIRIENGVIFNLPYHNERLNRTRRELFHVSFPLDLADYIRPETCRERTKCRVEYKAEIGKVDYAAYHIRPVSSLQIVEDGSIGYPYKSSDRRRLNELFGKRGTADDILIVRNGFLTDTSICNIALWDGKSWQTPHEPLLAGTKRAFLLDTGKIRSTEIHLSDLSRYSHVRLFNAMIEFGEIELPVQSWF